MVSLWKYFIPTVKKKISKPTPPFATQLGEIYSANPGTGRDNSGQVGTGPGQLGDFGQKVSKVAADIDMIFFPIRIKYFCNGIAYQRFQ